MPLKFLTIQSLKKLRKALNVHQRAVPLVLYAVLITSFLNLLFSHYAEWQWSNISGIGQKNGQLAQILSTCPPLPETLVGVKKIDTKVDVDLDAAHQYNKDVRAGGLFIPSSCSSKQRVAVIIPYRDRWHHLKLLLSVLHPMLQRQLLQYRLIIVQQAYNEIFNKGRIMNIAFDEALKMADGFDCFIFHDVDLLPETDYNSYTCGENPRHLSPAIDEMRYLLMYKKLAGGVLALNKSQVLKVNGYSNLYWGWGGEDDDMSHRIHDAGYVIQRPHMNIGRYKMIRHGKRGRAQNRYDLLDHWKRYPVDGVNSLKNLSYQVLSIEEMPLYTNITLDIGKMPERVESGVQGVEVAAWGWN